MRRYTRSFPDLYSQNFCQKGGCPWGPLLKTAKRKEPDSSSPMAITTISSPRKEKPFRSHLEMHPGKFSFEEKIVVLNLTDRFNFVDVAVEVANPSYISDAVPM